MREPLATALFQAPVPYDTVEALRGGLRKVWRQGKCGYLDAQGRVVIPVRWDAAFYQEPLARGLGSQLTEAVVAWVQQQHWVVVLRYDSTLVPDTYTRRAQPWRELPPPVAKGLAPRLLGFYTRDGHLVLPAQYAGFRRLSADYFAARLVGYRESVRQQRGDVVTTRYHQPGYQTQLVHRSGRALLGGRRLLPIHALYGDRLLVGREDGGDWQVLDTTGRVLIGPAPDRQPYYSLQPLNSDWTRWAGTVESPPRSWSYWQPAVYLLGATGEVVVPTLFTQLRPLGNGTAIASLWHRGKAAGTGVVELARGTWRIPPQYQALYRIGTEFVATRQPDPQQPARLGVLDSVGRVLIAARYEVLTPCRTQAGRCLPLWYARRHRRHWLVDPQGRVVRQLPRHGLVSPEQFDASYRLRLPFRNMRQPPRVLTLDLTGPRSVVTMAPLDEE